MMTIIGQIIPTTSAVKTFNAPSKNTKPKTVTRIGMTLR